MAEASSTLATTTSEPGVASAPVVGSPPPAADAAPSVRMPENADVRDLILVRYFASAAEAAGRDEESLSAVDTVGDLRAVLIAAYGDAMARVLRGGSFLVDGVVSRDDSRSVGQRVDVLPPFAGG